MKTKVYAREHYDVQGDNKNVVPELESEKEREKRKREKLVPNQFTVTDTRIYKKTKFDRKVNVRVS